MSRLDHVIHAITPGDHFSPRTGSAIPTVVHGLAGAAAQDRREPGYRHSVALGAGTWHPRYDSAAAIEFDEVAPPTRAGRLLDVARGRVGLPRTAAARYFAPQATAIRAQSPSIVLAHNAPALLPLLAGSRHRVVLYAHNNLFGTMTPGETARTLRGADAVVSVSDALAAELRERMPAPMHPLVHVVGNGVDTRQFRPGEREAGERLRVLLVGRMIPEKGADVLLDAVALLDRNDLEVLIVGSHGFDAGAALTPFERGLRARAAAVTTPVRFLPFEPRTALPALLRSADLLVVPSRWAEPWALTVGEGLASGLPVVAARAGGIPDALAGAGILVEREDAPALAAAIARLADDAELRRTMGAAARARAVERDWSWSWAQLRDVLDGLD